MATRPTASWDSLVADIRSCDRCRAVAPGHVGGERPILMSPGPPVEVDILFVGVAPTALEGKNKGAHFHSSQKDELRCGLLSLGGHLKPGHRRTGQNRPKGRALKAGCVVARSGRESKARDDDDGRRNAGRGGAASAIIGLAGRWGDTEVAPPVEIVTPEPNAARMFTAS